MQDNMSPTHDATTYFAAQLRAVADACEQLQGAMLAAADGFGRIMQQDAPAEGYLLIGITTTADPSIFYFRVDTRELEAFREHLQNGGYYGAISHSIERHGFDTHRFTLLGRYALRSEAVTAGRRLQLRHNSIHRH